MELYYSSMLTAWKQNVVMQRMLTICIEEAYSENEDSLEKMKMI